jgi:hypothetical protein
MCECERVRRTVGIRNKPGRETTEDTEERVEAPGRFVSQELDPSLHLFLLQVSLLLSCSSCKTTMNPTPPTSTTSSSRPNRPRRTRAPSTLSGMLSDKEEAISPSPRRGESFPNTAARVTSNCEKRGKDLVDIDAQDQRPVSVVEVVLRHNISSPPSRRTNDKAKEQMSAEDERRFLSRQLRRAKRRLLLKAVEPPSRPADRLRDMLRQLSLDSSLDNEDEDLADSRSFDCPSALSMSDADTVPSRS